MQDGFIQQLRSRLSHPLPGLDVQMQMAPMHRHREYKLPDNVRRGGVLALLYPNDGRLNMVFMKRTEDGSAHSGQVSFPGGSVEPSDPDPVYTALRETEEEIGIPKNEVEILGSLSRLYIPPSNFLVYPSVGYLKEKPGFIPDPIEVAGIIEAELDYLLDESIRVTKRVTVQTKVPLHIDAPAFQVHGHLIWGATAMMLHELLTLIREVREAVQS